MQRGAILQPEGRELSGTFRKWETVRGASLATLDRQRQPRHHQRHLLANTRNLLIEPPLLALKPPGQRRHRHDPTPTSFDTSTTECLQFPSQLRKAARSTAQSGSARQRLLFAKVTEQRIRQPQRQAIDDDQSIRARSIRARAADHAAPPAFANSTVVPRDVAQHARASPRRALQRSLRK